jgi:hypothetical protein
MAARDEAPQEAQSAPGGGIEAVVTRARFDVPLEGAWQRIMFFEEVPHRPSLLLRLVLPVPLSTRGEGKHVGAAVRCDYSRGHLVKRFTEIAPPALMRFEVIEQHLGIERMVTTVEGSYELRADGAGTLVALTTRYRGHLRPRGLWRPFERLLANALHRHILVGMGARAADFR